METAVIAFTGRGAEVALRLRRQLLAAGESCEAFAPARFVDEARAQAGLCPSTLPLQAWCGQHFKAGHALVFVGAVGIAVRAVAPWLSDKLQDPPVVVIDERAHFVIPLLSGHVGGANELAGRIAAWLGACPVITTATDINRLFAVDVFAARNGLAISDRARAKAVSAALLEGKPVGFFSDFELEGGAGRPRGCLGQVCGENVWITVRDGPGEAEGGAGWLRLVPRAVVLGIGCRRGISDEALEQAVKKALAAAGLDRRAVKAAATIDLKKEEPALLRLASRYGWELRSYSAARLAAVEGCFSSSDFVQRTAGVGNVCERAACCGGGALLLHKQAGGGVTVAAALEPPSLTLRPEGEV